MSIEKRYAEWRSQPGTANWTAAEQQFIADMRKAAAAGVGYGWMQQVIEWEWQDKSGHAWGPEYFDTRIAELEKKLKRAQRDGDKHD